MCRQYLLCKQVDVEVYNGTNKCYLATTVITTMVTRYSQWTVHRKTINHPSSTK